MLNLISLFAALCSLGSVAAQEAGGTPAAAGENGNFHILQLWTDDADRFTTQWNQPTPPNLSTTTRMERNQPLTQFIIFSNCTPDAAGNCLLNAEVTITRPDGEIYGEILTFPAYDNHPAPEANMLFLTPNSIGIRIEDGELLGPYLIRLALTDVYGNRTAISNVTLEAVEAPVVE